MRSSARWGPLSWRQSGRAGRFTGAAASHYAPGTPLRLDATTVRPDESLLAFGGDAPAGARVTINLSPSGNLEEAAAKLFAALGARPDGRFGHRRDAHSLDRAWRGHQRSLAARSQSALALIAMKAAPKHKPPSPDTADALVRIVGAEHAIRDETAMAPYLVEWRDRYRGKAALVLKPGATAEVSSILKIANETRTAIVPQGGNTGLVGGRSRSRADTRWWSRSNGSIGCATSTSPPTP